MQAYLLLVWVPAMNRDDRQHYLDEVTSHLLSLTRSLHTPLLETNIPKLYQILSPLLVQNPHWKELRLYNHKGRQIFPLERAKFAAGEYHQLISDLLYLGEDLGRLELTVDLEDVLSERKDHLHQLVWGVLLAIGIFLLASLGIVEFMVRRPVARLALASDQLSAGNFEAALPTKSGDEIGRLVGSFQAMREAIRNYQSSLHGEINERQWAEKLLRSRGAVLEQLTAGERLESMLESLIQGIEDLMPGMSCSVLLLDDSRKFLQIGASPSLPDFYNQAIEGLEIGPQVGSCGAAASLGVRVIAEDILTHPNWRAFRDLAQRAGLRSCWSEPIRASTGQVLGTFAMYYREPRVPDSAALELIQKAAQLAGIAIERKRTERALQTSEARFRALYDENPSMFFTVSAKGKILSANEYAAAQLATLIDDLVGESWLNLHAEEDQPAMADRFAACMAEPGQIHRWEVRKFGRDGNSLQVRESARAVTSDSGGLIVLCVCEDITEAHQLSQQLSHQASHDALTGLVNRREFEDRLERVLHTAQEEQTENAICFLDLDRFKIINDTCGHIAGDELLRQLSVILNGQVRKRDTLARIGGDEFGVLLENCPLDNAERVASALLQAVEEFRFVWEQQSFNIGVSIGMAPITHVSGSVNAVLSAADNACYAAKELGRGRMHTYHEDDTELAGRYLEQNWVARIKEVLEHDRFQLWYQSIIPLAGNSEPQPKRHLRIELLLRMLDKQGRLIQPGAFLPAAERYQLAPELDRWVVGHALDELSQHPQLLEQIEFCSLNLSGLSLGDEAFLDFVLDRLASSGIAGERICF